MPTKEKLRSKSDSRVVVLNDDFTPMDFVVNSLKAVFGMSASKANAVMLDVHRSGKGIGGVYPYSIASEKKDEMNRRAAAYSYPLKTEIEEL